MTRILAVCAALAASTAVNTAAIALAVPHAYQAQHPRAVELCAQYFRWATQTGKVMPALAASCAEFQTGNRDD